MSGGQFDWGGRLLKGNGGARRSPQNDWKPFKRMILLAMLWDLEKGKEVVRMDGELHE